MAKARRRRNYRKEYDEYHGSKEQKLRRADRNRANRKAKKEGRIREGDGREVHHVGSNRTGRLRNVRTKVISRAKNRRMQPKRP